MMSKSRFTFALVLALCASSAAVHAAPTDTAGSLLEARRGFATHIVKAGDPDTAPEAPPAGVFKLVRYTSPAGKLAAYLTPSPNDGARHPAIVWVTGGD